MTKVEMPASWVRDGSDLSDYFRTKGLTYCGHLVRDAVVVVDLVEDLDAGQRTTLRSDLLTDFNPVSVEPI